MKRKKMVIIAFACGLVLCLIGIFLLNKQDSAEVNIRGVDVIGSSEVATEAVKTLEPFSESVMACYEGEFAAPEEACFATPYLYEQLAARNWYIAQTQQGYDVLKQENGFKLERVHVIDDSTVKVLARRTISQTLAHKKEGNELPFESNANEGYVLRKIGDEWKIARFIDGLYADADAEIETFKQAFASKDVSAAQDASEKSIDRDLCGVDYIKAYKERSRMEIEY